MLDVAPVALVTGAARRLGAEMARALAGAGFHVVVHYNASAQDAQSLAAEIRAAGGRCDLVTGDLQTRAGAESAFEAARAVAGPVSLLVNNASTFHNDDVFTMSEPVLDNHMAVNLRAPLWLTAKLAAQADLPERALIVNMLDNKLFALNPDFFTYTLSKAALKAATELCALRFQGRPRVCGIAPSITLVSGEQSMDDFHRTARVNPLKRRVAPADICETLLLLWNDPGLDGEILVVDGGQVHLNLPRDVAFLDLTGGENG